MSEAAVSRGGWFSLISSAATAVVVGFASTILLIMQAAQAVGATPAQQASWAAVLVLRHGAHLILSLVAHKHADHHGMVHAGGGADCHQRFGDQLRTCAGGLRGGGAAHVPHRRSSSRWRGPSRKFRRRLRRRCWPACC